jgi:hypothetical protein
MTEYDVIVIGCGVMAIIGFFLFLVGQWWADWLGAIGAVLFVLGASVVFFAPWPTPSSELPSCASVCPQEGVP